MAEWELRRVVQTDSNGYVRIQHDVGGNAVMYDSRVQRKCWGYVNGVYWEQDWPDTSAMFDGDPGGPVNYGLKYEAGVWYLYAYVYSGKSNRSEWLVPIELGGGV